MSAPHTRLGRVRVGDAMRRGVVSCPPNLPLSEIARLMAEHRVHCVVLEASGTHDAVGWSVVSDRDLVSAAGADQV
jgi:CBS domain-containing protein